MKKMLGWWMVHAAHWAVLYGAFVLSLEGAMYVLKFSIWIMAPFSLALLADKAAQDGAKNPPAPVRAALSWAQAWTQLALLVWFGHIVTALAWCVVMLMIAVYDNEVRKIRTAAPAA